MLFYTSRPALSEIKNVNVDYISIVRNNDFYSRLSKDHFSNALANEYKSLSLYKYQYANDLKDANHFALKALTAYHGERVKPDNIYKRNLPINNIVEISNNYDDLQKILSSEIQNTYPQLVAEAQAKFDCWIESAEDGLQKQALNCKQRFTKAKNKLLAIMDTDCFKCKSKKTETTITKTQIQTLKQFDGKHISIPKWPNMPLIKNNPPQPVIVAQNDISRDLKSITDYIKSIESSLEYLKANQQTTKIVRGNGKETIVVNDPNNATKSDIAELKKYLKNLQRQINELKSRNNNENFAILEDRLNELSEQIDNIEIPDCCNNNCEDDDDELPYDVINEDDYIEEEIFDEPSNYLPFEIFFDWDKDNVDNKFLPQLKDISEKALSSKETIIIQGHTDTSGTPEYNQKLSNRRAKNVGKIIESHGIPAEKITIQAMGSTELKVPTANGVKKAENRRVVIK